VGDDDIERAAKRHREKVAAEATRTAAVDADLPARKRRYANEMIERSLGSLDGAKLLIVLVDIALVVGLFALAIRIAPRSENVQIAGGIGVTFVAIILCMLVVPMLASSLLVRLRRNALGRVGYGFDVPAYLALLSEQRRDSRLVVTLGFADGAQPAAALPDAIKDWLPAIENATWIDGRLRLESRELETTDTAGGGGKSMRIRFFTNERIHSCFRKVLAAVVPRVSASCRVTQLAVAIDGRVAPFEEDA
jgi:hypothetical protein